jgi:membrane-bound serine protease (ClpP class)
MSRSSRIGAILLAAISVAGIAAPGAIGAPVVREVVLDRSIDPVTARFVVNEIEAAAGRGDAAVVLRIDTPGGLDRSMREINAAELAAPIPVVVFVAPDGARAASAGVFVLMASDLAAMAPQTNLGSSTPVAGGRDIADGDLKRKIVNDAAARVRTLAVEHGRNGAWAERAVREAANATAREALDLGVIELVATDLTDLLRQVDGRTTVPKGLTIEVTGAVVETRTLPLHLAVLDVLIDPNLLALLLFGGLALIAFEVAHPGGFVPGAAGGAMVIVALLGISVLPFTWAGLLLLGLGMALVVAETVVGHGALGLTGIAAFAGGALLLFDDEEVAVWTPGIVVTAVALAAGLLAVIARTAKVRHLPAATGNATLIGLRAEVREALDPDGLVFLRGELWTAISATTVIPAGQPVIVDRVEGLTLHVHPAPTEEVTA